MKILVVEPLKVPYEKEIDGSLASMQAVVGGLIQLLYPFEDPELALICNDEGKIMGLPYEGGYYNVIVTQYELDDLKSYLNNKGASKYSACGERREDISSDETKSLRVVHPTRRDFVKYHGKYSAEISCDEFLEVPLNKFSAKITTPLLTSPPPPSRIRAQAPPP